MKITIIKKDLEAKVTFDTDGEQKENIEFLLYCQDKIKAKIEKELSKLK